MASLIHRHDAQVIVIGGGVIGSACAFRLAQAGRDVLLLQFGTPERAASFGNAGHIATEQLFPLASAEVIRSSWRYLLDADSPLRLRPAYLLALLPWLASFVWAARGKSFRRGVAALLSLQQSALVDMADLLADADLASLLHQRGHLEVWETPAGEAAALTQAQRLGAYGIKTAPWSLADLRSQLPELGQSVQGALHYPGSGHVEDPWAVCSGLHLALRRSGGRIRQGRVLQLHADKGYANVLLEDGSRLQAQQLLVCAGAWSRPLAASLGYRVPLEVERGYHITIGRPADGVMPPRLPLPVASNERKVIMSSMSMGLRMTGTVEFGGLQLPADPRRFDLLQRQLQAMLPGIDSRQASHWMGFRPSLPDHLPVLGAATRHTNVFFAFGHQHLGLTLAAVTARAMTQLMQSGESPVDLAPFSVSSFGA
jgi:D-amino-acid dehydrogenase